MTSVAATGADLFAPLSNQQSTMAVLAKNAIARGTERYAEGDIDGARREFQRALALDPVSDNTLTALNLIAQTYLGQNRTEDAIATYEKAIRLSPTSVDPHLKLGNVYYGLERFEEARSEYQAALRLDPMNATAILSVGQAAMADGDLREAESRFRQVIGSHPGEYGGYHALGQVLSKQGRGREAVAAFEKALELDRNFSTARVDLGIALADLGNLDAAEDQLTILRQTDSGLAALLYAHLQQTEAPAFLAAYSPDGRFDTTAGVGTAISSLDSELAAADAVAAFEMNFLFSKTMDPTSVSDISKWQITRAPLSAPGGGYNWGRTEDPNDAAFSPTPVSVIYDPDSLTATVVFLVYQSSTASATMDPQHIQFRFRGVDAYGNAMDAAADEFSGISRIA
jgi:tetratricopeptide (TPR) repeat protein